MQICKFKKKTTLKKKIQLSFPKLILSKTPKKVNLSNFFNKHINYPKFRFLVTKEKLVISKVH